MWPPAQQVEKNYLIKKKKDRKKILNLKAEKYGNKLSSEPRRFYFNIFISCTTDIQWSDVKREACSTAIRSCRDNKTYK